MKIKKEKNDEIERKTYENTTLLFSAIIPRHIIKTKDKVSNLIIEDFFNKGEQSLKMEKNSGKAKPVTTKVTFSYEGVDIQAKQDFTAFDREVHDSIVSLYIYGNDIFTPSMVYRAMTGKTDSEYVAPSILTETIKSIDKCLFSRIAIDATEEVSHYGLKNAVFSGYLISANKISGTLNGQPVSAYKFLDIPILYQYANQKNQLATIPIKLLDTPIRKTSDIIVLQGYLIRRIESMKNPKSKTSNTILYDAIYKCIKVSDIRQKRERVRKDTKTILNYWIQHGYIASYKEIAKGKLLYSIVINF